MSGLRKASGVWGFDVCAVARPTAPPRRDPRVLGRRRGRLRGAAARFLCTPSLTNNCRGTRICAAAARRARAAHHCASGAARRPRCAPGACARRPSAQKGTKCCLSRSAYFTRARAAKVPVSLSAPSAGLLPRVSEVSRLAVRRAALLSRFQTAWGSDQNTGLSRLCKKYP